MKRIVFFLILTTLTLVACDSVPKALELSGPSEVTREGAMFTATATGGYPLGGSVYMIFYLDKNNNDFPESSERLKARTVVPDTNLKAISRYWWTPKSSERGQNHTFSAMALFFTPGTDEAEQLNVELPVTTTE